MKTYWHGDREVVIIRKDAYAREGFATQQIMLTLDMGDAKMFHMWESDFLKHVIVRYE
jgi:hypothetical protein